MSYPMDHLSAEDQGHLETIARHFDSLHSSHPTRAALKQHANNDDHQSMAHEIKKAAQFLGIPLGAASIAGIAYWFLKAAKA